MDLIRLLEQFHPFNPQESADRLELLRRLKSGEELYDRGNLSAHFTVSAWVTDPSRTKVLMAYHNLYDSWAWLGGHADGERDLLSVALREVQEESGLDHLRPLSDEIFSIEILPVSGHEKKGQYIPSHVHLNITFLLEGDPSTPLCSKPDENSAVAWFSLDDAVAASSETWFQQRIYSKLNEKLRQFP